MGNKLGLAVIGFAVFCASPSWAGATGNGWSQPTPAAVPSQAQQQQPPPPQNPQTWVLHGKKVSCDSTRGWRHSEYISHCGSEGMTKPKGP